MDKGVLVDFVKAAREDERKKQTLAMELCRDILNSKENKRVDFLPEGEDKDDYDLPCTNVAESRVSDDVVSANVSAIFLENGDIFVDLHYYYHQEGECHVFIENDNEFDWLEMLNCLALQV